MQRLIIKEYKNVLKRDFEYQNEEVNQILEVLLQCLTIVLPKEKVNIIIDDPEDNKIIECAIESKSDYIITYDKHLLKINNFRGIEIVKPENFSEFS